MDRETMIAILVDHSEHPRHQGRLEDADVRVPGGNPGCGDVITLHVKADADAPRIAEVSFEGTGCTISQAAASILLKQVNRDKPSFEDVLQFPYEDMVSLLGREVVGSRYTCATLALGTLKQAVQAIEMDRKLRAAGHSPEEIKKLREMLARTT
jgi:nitrogen fixation NifU-like protein